MSSASGPVVAQPRRRRTLWIVGGLLLVGLAAGVAWSFARPSLELDAAEAALRRNDPQAARLRLDHVLARRPKDERALFLAAQAARRSDAYADAERYLTALDGTGRPAEASRLEWVLLGVQQGDFGDQEEWLRGAVGRNHPEEAGILEALAKGYDAAFRWERAQEALARLLDRQPDHVIGLVLRAAIADRFRKTETAEQDLRLAVAKSPDNATAHAALAGFLNSHGHTREAIYHYELARCVGPADTAMRLGLARALFDSANLDGASRELDSLLAEEPNNVEALVERGRLAVRRGQFTEADQFLDRATRAAPWHRDAHRWQHVALKELGRNEAAARCEARLAELGREDAEGGRLKLRARDAPSDLAVRMKLWEWSVRNGQIAEGVAWLTEVLQVDPGHAAAHAAFADYFNRTGQPR